MSCIFFKRRFSSLRDLIVTSLYLITMVFLMFLGFWQLHRADEKSDILRTEAAYAKKAAILWSPSMGFPRHYQRISIKGQVLPYTLFLDNQHHQHQFGYHLLTPIELKNGKVILVDRGWIKGDISRREYPNPALAEIKYADFWTGEAYFPSDKTWSLGQLIEKKGQNFAVIEKIDPQLIAHLLQKSVYPFIIRLGAREANGFARNWSMELGSMSPARHQAYALQWFVMSFVVLVIFIGLSFREKHEV